MKRRDFIKAFTAVSASVPLASALAKTSGAESIIETFTIKEMKKEVTGNLIDLINFDGKLANLQIFDKELNGYEIQRDSSKDISTEMGVVIHTDVVFVSGLNEIKIDGKYIYEASFVVETMNPQVETMYRQVGKFGIYLNGINALDVITDIENHYFTSFDSFGRIKYLTFFNLDLTPFGNRVPVVVLKNI